MTTHTATPGRSYANLTLVERALDVLECANRWPVVSVQLVSRECGIPAPSVVRILETLCDRGYLAKNEGRRGYRLAGRVRSLSAGFHGSPMLVELMRQHVDELTREFLWPFSVATLDRDSMVVRYSSIPISPLAHKNTTLHQRLCLFSRAHGIAYAAFCSARERHHLVRASLLSESAELAEVGDALTWRRLLRQTRSRGFALRSPRIDPSTRSAAVPIVASPGHVVATLGVTYFPRSVKTERLNAYIRAMQKVAAIAAAEINV